MSKRNVKCLKCGAVTSEVAAAIADARVAQGLGSSHWCAECGSTSVVRVTSPKAHGRYAFGGENYCHASTPDGV